LSAGLAALGCSRAPALRSAGAPVVLISIDTLRADHLPAYGYAGVKTPHLDRLRRDAILYEQAWSPAPLTLPAHVSVLTGLLPFEHGVRDNLGYRLDAKAHPTLAGLLRGRGYATGAFVSAHVLRAGTGLGEGFDVYDDHMAAPGGGGMEALGRVQRRGEETLARARVWLAGVATKPFFLFLHLYEPHAPYEPPEPFRSATALAYDGEIAKSDEIVGGLLDELRRSGIYDRALVVLLSDHGEGLGEHGEDEHGILLYRWALHVPLLVKLPGSARANTTVSAPVHLVDVLPTLAALLEVPAPRGLSGRSLLADPPEEPRRLYAETFYPRIHLGWSELRSLRDERWQYVEGSRRELYDLREDPRELTDRLASDGPTARAFQAQLARYPAALAMPADVAAEDLEKLAALGYLGGSAGARAGPLPDPRQSIHALADVKAAFRLAAAGRDQEAVVAFGRVLDVYPLLFDARYELGQALARLGRHAEAYEAFKAALRASPSLAGPISLALGRVCLKLGRHDEAEANARVALRSSPAPAHELLARIALARDDLATAEREAQQATGAAEAELGAAVVRAEVHIRRGQLPEALTVLEAARRRGGEQGLEPVVDLDFLRGDALARLGRYPEAEAAFQEEIRRYPRNAQAYARLAIVYGLQRRSVTEVDRVLKAMVAASPGREARELAAKTLDSMGDPRGARAWRQRER
jgi:arylsulfatase A-like enzyme/Flp pilus assembly protein TadD